MNHGSDLHAAARDGRAPSADVQATQSLQDGYLPIPTVAWTHPQFSLATTAFAAGTPGDSRVVARHRLTNTGTASREYALALAVQPWQVNPPQQFLTTPGGIEDRLRGLELHEDDYLLKPFEAKVLVMRVKKLLRRDRGR